MNVKYYISYACAFRYNLPYRLFSLFLAHIYSGVWPELNPFLYGVNYLSYRSFIVPEEFPVFCVEDNIRPFKDRIAYFVFRKLLQNFLDYFTHIYTFNILECQRFSFSL